MKHLNKAGFTIIETMLFLGISGLLIVGILIGTGSSINTQRYRDSVTSLQSFLQQQYSNVANVSNDNTTTECGGLAGLHVGQTDCAILGKYITTSNEGKIINVITVLGTIVNLNDGDNDLDAFKNALIYTSSSSVDVEEYEIEWGSSIKVKQDNEDKSALYMLILRSPSSGVTRTFISDSEGLENIRDIITENGALYRSAKLCVDSNGLFTGNGMAVSIDGNSTSASGIKILGNNSGC